MITGNFSVECLLRRDSNNHEHKVTTFYNSKNCALEYARKIRIMLQCNHPDLTTVRLCNNTSTIVELLGVFEHKKVRID